MKYFKHLLLLCLMVAGISVSHAQESANPSKTARWDYTYKKIGANEYEIVFHLDLRKGFHVFTESDDLGKKKKKRNSPSIVIPSFKFDEIPGVKLKGGIVSKGMLETRRIDKIGLVNIYSYKVLYTQIVEAKPGTTLTGSHTYQVCDDENDIAPPFNELFSIEIK